MLVPPVTPTILQSFYYADITDLNFPSTAGASRSRGRTKGQVSSLDTLSGTPSTPGDTCQGLTQSSPGASQTHSPTNQTNGLVSVTALRFASALALQIPANPVSGGITDILWTNEVHDPTTWSLFLMDSRDPSGLRAILGENVDPAPQRLTNIQLPIMKPGLGITTSSKP